MTKERFCDKPGLSTLSKTLEAMKIHAKTNGGSTIAVPKLGCGLDPMNGQQDVKLLKGILCGVHSIGKVMSAEGGAEFYLEDQIER